jgi:hypothetical protein
MSETKEYDEKSPFKLLAWTMADLHNILAESYATCATMANDFARIGYMLDDACVCDLYVNHPEEGSYIAAYIDHEWLTDVTNRYALMQVAAQHGLRWVEKEETHE